MNKESSFWIIVLSAGLFFLPDLTKGQVIVETFESAAWTTINAASASTNTINVTATTSSQTITSYSASTATAVTTLTSGVECTGNWTWMYSKASVSNLNANWTNSAISNSSKLNCHSSTSTLRMTSGGYLITPVLQTGVTAISFWMAGATGNATLQVGANTINTTFTGYTTGVQSQSTATNSYGISTSNFTTNNGTAARTQFTWIGNLTAPARVAFESVQGLWIDDIVITAPLASTTPNPTAITFTTPSSCLTDRLTISWTGPTGYSSSNNTLLGFLKQGSAVTVGTPNAALSTYTTASTDFSSPGTAYQNDASAYCIYKGDGTNAAGSHSGLTITGLAGNTTYHLLLFNVVDATPTYSTGATGNGTTLNILAEPTNQPTLFAKGTVTTSNIPLTWTAAAAGAQAPDGYLISASNSATPVDPVDGTDNANQTDISGGTANVKTSGTSYSSFTGFSAGTMYYFRINSYTNSGNCIDYKAAGPALNAATAPNAVTTPGISISGGTGIISWSAAAGYDNTKHTTLVFVKATSAVTVGTPSSSPGTYTANTALGSGTAYQLDAGAGCVYNGDGTSATVTGLSAGVTYHVLILTVMSSSNSDATYSYSSYVVTSAAPPAEYTWIGGASGSWATSTNWSPTRTTPASTDVLTINSPGTVTTTSVPAQTIAKLTVNSNCAVTLQSASSVTLTVNSDNGSADDLIVSSGASLTISDSLNITLGTNTTANISGTLTVNNGRTYNTNAAGAVTNLTGLLINSGTVTSTNAARLIVFSTGIYKHNINGGTIPTGTWNTGSRCWVTGVTSAGNFSSGNGQTFSNFIWDCAGQSAAYFVLCENSGNNFVVSDTFMVLRTNGKLLQFTSSGSQKNITVGNYYQYGGKVAVTYNTEAGGEQRSLTVNNTYYVTDSIETNAEFQIINQPTDQNITGRLFVKGRVEMHKTNSAAILTKIGNIYKAEVNFTGASAQSAAFDRITGDVDFVINNPISVTLLSNATTYRCRMQQGNFFIGSNTLTINGPVSYPSPGTGLFAGSATSNLSIGSQGHVKNDTANILKFLSGYQILKNFSLSDTANAILGTNLALTAGTGYGKLIMDSLSTLTTNDSLTLKSDANGTARVDRIPVNGSGVALITITGKMTIERYLPMNTPYSSRRWRLLTAPVGSATAPTINASWQEGATSTDRLNPVDPNPPFGTAITKSTTSANGFDQGSTNNPSIYYMVPGSGSWSVPSATNSGKITDYKGYMVFVRGDRSIVVSNQFINTTGGANLRVKGDIRKGNDTTTTAVGYQIIGNPYASSVSLKNVLYNNKLPGSNLGTTYYLWDPKLIGSKGVGAWVTFSSNGNNTFTGVPNAVDSGYMSPYTNTGMIESGAAFMINSTAVGSFIFHESDKVDSSTTKGIASRPANRPTDKLAFLYTNLAFLSTENEPLLADGVATIYGKDLHNEVDEQDASKLQTFTSKEKISLLRDNAVLAIERRENLKFTDTIFYSVSIESNNNYQLQFNGSDFDPTLKAILEDDFTGIKKEIPTEGISRYNFNTTASAASIAFNRFRIVFLRKNSGPLPVTITDIRAVKSDHDIKVEWNVENEINIDHYEIERSVDGIHFFKIADMPSGAANVNGYTYLDADALAGINYYRIRSIGINTGYSYSKTVKVNLQKAGSLITVFPTLVNDRVVHILFSDPAAGKYQVRLINISGQVLQQVSFVNNGQNATGSFQINKTIPPGKYHIEVLSPDKNNTVLPVVVAP